MKRLPFLRTAAVVSLALALAPTKGSSQDSDALTITGTFGMDQIVEPVGSDLAAVFANGHEHSWTLTLYGVTYSHDYSFYESSYEWEERYITHVHATSFNFEFFGPDAGVLNEVVSSPLTDTFCDLTNVAYYDYDTLTHHSELTLQLSPPGPDAGVMFDCYAFSKLIPTDPSGCPVVEPELFLARVSVIRDWRLGNGGVLFSRDDPVAIGTPPALPPSMRIADASGPEGDRGTSRLDLVVSLSAISGNVVTVNYATASGSALAGKDYTATSGTLTFQPGEMNRTISVAIKGDRNREPNETFRVQLSNAVGATISDGSATATIMNDD